MKILLADKAHPLLAKTLAQAGHQCVDGSFDDASQLIKTKNTLFEGIIVRSRMIVDKKGIDHFPKLRFVGRIGAGMENIDVAYAKSKGIVCFNSPEGNQDSVAEHAVGMLLMLLNNLLRADSEVRKGLWLREENRGVELMNKTVGIVGYGNMGKAFARRLSGFGVRILAYDKYKKKYGNKQVKECRMEELFSKCDVLSLHVPLTDETKFMVNHDYLSRFKKNIFLINTARGKVLRTDDLVKNLKSGKVLGACLDVNEYENTSFEKISNLKSHVSHPSWKYLLKSDKVVLAPHIAGWSDKSEEKMALFLAEKILKRFKR